MNNTTVSNWKVSQLPDQAGKTFLITGANSGLGLEAAKYLRNANANVIVGARSMDKGQRAVTELEGLSGSGSVQLLQVDLADTGSVTAADTAVRELTDGLDAIINNAGIMQTPQLKTADGFEMQFGTNHLGHFLLNQLMFDLVQARAGRIVPVASIAHHRTDALQFDDLMFDANYSATAVYCHSKLANLVYGIELARRLDAAGSDVISASCHPGYSATNLQSTGPTGLFKFVYKLSNKFVAQSAADGAVPEVLAAAGSEARNGAYYGPTSRGDMNGPVGESRISSAAKDPEAGQRLWEASEELLGISFDVS